MERQDILTVSGLFDFYLERGCPCRFPRFCALVEQTLPYGFASSDCAELLALLEQRLEVRGKVVDPALGWVGHCAICDSQITFRDVPIFRDASVAQAKILVSKDLVSLGAAPTGLVPYRRPPHPVIPGVRAAERREVSARYPLLPEADWFLHLSALRDRVT